MVRIFTDSTADLTKPEQDELGVTSIPLTVHFGSESFLDGVDLTYKEFYTRLRSVTELPTTSQVAPARFEEIFRSCVEAGDDVVGLFISSDLSGTCQSAKLAAEAVDPSRVFAVDSRTATLGLNAMVRQAVRLRDQGLSAAEIAGEMERLSGRIRLVAAVDTLKYLRMGGRLSTLSAVVGEVLGIRPLIQIKDGKVISHAKARGHKATMNLLVDYIKEYPMDLTRPIVPGHIDSLEHLNEVIEAIAPFTGGVEVFPDEIGCVVGVHVGPGAAGVAYFEAE